MRISFLLAVAVSVIFTCADLPNAWCSALRSAAGEPVGWWLYASAVSVALMRTFRPRKRRGLPVVLRRSRPSLRCSTRMLPVVSLIESTWLINLRTRHALFLSLRWAATVESPSLTDGRRYALDHAWWLLDPSSNLRRIGGAAGRAQVVADDGRLYYWQPETGQVGRR